jgi:hypothetical protein
VRDRCRAVHATPSARPAGGVAPREHAALRAEEALAGPTSLITCDDAQILAVEMLSERETADARALGV